MKTVILGDPPAPVASLIAERQRLGLDTHDEVWEGEYHMAPAASSEHSRVQVEITWCFRQPASSRGMTVSVEFNLGTPGSFRVPDVAVHRGAPTEVWLDTAAVVVEVRSPDDESFDKFGFYFDHGVEEVLTADLTAHEVRWFVRGGDGFAEADASTLLGLTSHEIAAALGW